ncbi:sugar transferase [Noviherbaspirillum sp.]|uniref:sugar transferase n=1 Tax=Noviherbaspirillum sp. TaxID=1926288 RepID=UPI0025EBA9BA|nr:sugar transferase [Noviherbaspirillum sp.]
MKRPFDVLAAFVLLLLVAPILLLTAVLLKLDSPGPILFTQKRLGLNGRIFDLYKFRSMVDVPRTPARQVYGGDPEVTRVGKFIRRFKIDELPQLLNVLKGDMSIVGPRPCLPDLQAEFDENGRSRIAVRPGLTGLAQVNGNIFLSWPERWRLDRMYVDNLSFVTDCRILWKTVFVVLLGEKRTVP